MLIGFWPFSRSVNFPDTPAFFDLASQRPVSSSDFACRTASLSHVLFRTHGVNCGERVAVVSENLLFHFTVFFACASIGAVYMPLDFRWKEECLQAALAQGKPRLLLYDGPNCPAERFSLRKQPVGEAEEECARIGASYPVDETEILGETPLCLFFSEKEDGLRGSVMPQAAVMWNAFNTLVSYRFSRETLYMKIFDAHWDYMAHALAVFAAGGTVVTVPPGELPDLTVAFPGKRTPTHLFLPPEALERMLKEGAAVCGPYVGVDNFYRASETLLREIRRSGFPCFSHVSFPTAGPNNFIGDSIGGEEISLGTPLFNVQVKIADGEGRELAEGETGEFSFRGMHTFSGYWNDAAATEDVFLRGWTRSGVRGFVRDGRYCAAAL